MIAKLVTLLVLVCATQAAAQQKSFALEAPPELVETGLLKYLLPRFSLKTGIRIRLEASGADAAFGQTGVPVFRKDERIWYFRHDGSAHPARFADWLVSDVGKRTIETYAPQGTGLFSTDVDVAEEVTRAELTGDADLGARASLEKCGRCHVVNDSNRMKAIGSSPSFALLRTFGDWQERFETFFMLKPHPAFTQVEGITDPFDETRPPPIAPIEVTWEEIEAITTYVGSIRPADLGAPIRSQ